MQRLYIILFVYHYILQPSAMAQTNSPSVSKKSADLEIEAIDRTFSKLQSHLTINAFLAGLKKDLSPELHSFLVRKIQGKGSAAAPKLKREAPKVFKWLYSGMEIPFKVVSLDEGKFLINNKYFVFSPTAPPQQALDSMASLLPLQSTSWIEYVIPSANALLPTTVAAIAFLASASVFVNLYGCNVVLRAESLCLSESMNLSTERRRSTPVETEGLTNTLRSLANTRDSLLTRNIYGCNEQKERLSECISGVLGQMKLLYGIDPLTRPSGTRSRGTRD